MFPWEVCSNQPQTHQKVEGTLLYMDSTETLSGFQGSPEKDAEKKLMS